MAPWRPTLRENMRDLLGVCGDMFMYMMRAQSGNFVVGLVMVLLLFTFTSLGLSGFFWWAAAMLISLAALIAYERWRR
jgi:uncharacterized membrane protein YdbT with pleckstrin-like domain